jgi:hypothetical protein
MTPILRLAIVALPVLAYAQQDSNRQQPKPPPKEAAKKQPPASRRVPDEFGKTRISRDDTGYIESAFIQSLVRFRFDAAFDDRNIDLANYFYSAGLANQVAKLNFREYQVKIEYAFGRRLSAFIDTPIRTLAPQASFQCQPECTAQSQTQTVIPAANTAFSGLSDVKVGLKVGLLNRPNEQLTFQLSASIPTGNNDKGLGTGHATIEPYLLYARSLNAKANVFGEFGDSHPFSNAQSFVFDPTRSTTEQNFAADVLNYGLGASYALRQQSRVRITPVLELVGWKVTGGLASIVAPGPTGQPVVYVVPPNSAPAFGSNIVNLKGGWRTFWGEHHSIYTGVGVELSHAGWYREILRIEYRYRFDQLPWKRARH